MPEPTTAELNEELQRLRTTNVELLQKKNTLKTRVAELEGLNASLTSKNTELTAEIRAIRVDVPVRELAGEMSNNPDLFLEQLAKTYRVESNNGELQLFTNDGQRVVDKDGKPLPLARKELTELLTAKDHPNSKTFGMIVIASKGSGTAGSTQLLTHQSVQPKNTAPPITFGLR